MNLNEVKVRKKDKSIQPYNFDKIKIAISKSADRVLYNLEDYEIEYIKDYVESYILKENSEVIDILKIHSFVEKSLDKVAPPVAKSYREYRDYKTDFVAIVDSTFKKAQKIMYIGDKENSNSDSALVSTKRCLIFNEFNKELYKKFFLNYKEIQAIKDGYIYIHDMSSRRDTFNCCLFNVGAVLTGGFEMGNLWYNEPKTLDVAFDVIGDIVISAASQQYGGFTIPSIELILEPYAKKSYNIYHNEYLEIQKDTNTDLDEKSLNKKAHDYAMKKVERDFMQGFQGLEYKFNSVASSRGDYPFITVTAGTGTSEFAKMATITLLRVRMNGQGKKEHKKPVLFPKIVFLYDKNLHGPGCELEDVFNEGILCSSKTMYPDWLSLTSDDPDNTLCKMYKEYGAIISPMGCRAFLSPWWEKGGMEKADDSDRPVFIGRFNIGVVSLNLPMIYAKSKQESTDFYSTLDYYLEMIRNIHKRTYDYLGERRASTNPLAFCEGGLYGGHLNPNDKIRPLLKSATASFGITALNELQQLYNNKSIYEDGEFTLEVMKYINDKVNAFKREDGILYAIYGTPAENLCGLQVKQFRSMYGVVRNVSDREYVSNSFHCHVSERITPIQKQDSEYRFWKYFQGGRIQYVKYPIDYNIEAIKTLVRRAMDMGLYEGVNLSLSYCDNCGHEELNMDVCPKCGSTNLTKIDRMNGYLSYSRVKGDTRLNDAKMAEISDRVSM